MIVGRLIPAGTGFAYHAARRQFTSQSAEGEGSAAEQVAQAFAPGGGDDAAIAEGGSQEEN